MRVESKREKAQSRNGSNKGVGMAARWLHIYVSMFGLLALLFFSITGITLNHPDLFLSDFENQNEFGGTISKDWMGDPSKDTGEEALDGVDRLSIVEYFRSTHGIEGAVKEFSGDKYELAVVFAGPGYSADGYIDRSNGDYVMRESSEGVVALLNDLHKGRDTGKAWAWTIDVSAVILLLASLSGIYLLLGLRRRRRAGLISFAVGVVAMLLVYLLWVP